MATFEKRGVLSYKDKNGDVHRLLPVTEKENVLGLNEALDGIVLNLVDGETKVANSVDSDMLGGKDPSEYALSDEVVYYSEEQVETIISPLNADTLGGNSPEYFVSKKQFDTMSSNIESIKAYVDSLRSSIMSSIYPVGSVYISITSTNPEILFGGTWERLKDRFLLGAGSNHTAGSTGGEETHKLTVSEIPSHSHGLWSRAAYSGGGSFIAHCNQGNAGDYNYVTGKNGGGEAHNNMPPYLAVYMWKRTA